MRKFLSILMVLALVTALFVSCSQDKVGNVVGEDLVSVSFATGDSSRTLTVSREAFDENDYIWCYTATKADNSGMTQGQTTEEQYVWGDDHTKTGLTGATIEGISQGLWNFTLRAYVPVYEGETITGKSDVMAWFGSVTNQPVRKGEANVVNVTVSAVVDPTKEGIITFKNVVVRKLNETDVTALSIWTGDKDLILGVKATTLAGAAVDGAFVEYKKGEGHTPSNIPEPKFEVAAGTYFVTFKAYEGTFAEPTFVYAEETIAVNVYSGLRTIISGFVSELSSFVQFGEPVANAVVEAQTNSVIDVDPEDPDVEFNTDSTQSTSSYQAASIPAEAVYAIKGAVDVPSESTLTDLALALNVKDEGSTDAPATTTKKFDISLDAIVTTTNQTSGAVSVDTQSVNSLGEDIMVVALYIGKNLTIQEVWHDGTELHETAGDDGEFYSYDLDEGILTLHVNHFSPFSVIYEKEVAVARLIKADGTGADFYTLEEAVDAAVAGDTVKLLKDVEISATATKEADRLTISEDITIDFGMNKLIAPGSLEPTRNFAALWITGNVVFEGTTGGIDCLDNQDDCGPYCVNIMENGTLTVNGGVYHGGGTVIQVTLGKLYINGGTFTATPFDEPYVYDFTINCKDSAYQAGTAKVVIRGGLFDHFNPEDNKSEGEHTDYVPLDCLVNEIGDGWYKVTPLTLVKAVDATCSSTGTHTYWKDSAENKYIVDEYNETRRVATEEDLIIPAHHAYVFDSYTTEDCNEGYCRARFICLNCKEGDEGHVKEELRPLVIPGEGVDLYNLVTKSTFVDGSVIQLGSANYNTSEANQIEKSFVMVGAPDGSSVLTVKTQRGTKMWNRKAPLPEKSWQYANLTIQGENNNSQWHLILFTGQKAEIGFNNVTIKNFTGKSIFGLWENQDHQSYEGKIFPCKGVYPDTYINMKDIVVDDKTVSSSSDFIQIQSYEKERMQGNNSDSYESVHISYSAAGEDFIATQINIQPGNHYHDGVHNEWFLNGQIMEGIPGTDGTYGD